MINDQILDYIRQQQKAGISKENIVTNLTSAGWSPADINEAFTKVTLVGTTPVTPLPPVKRNPIYTWGVVILIAIGIIAPSIYKAIRAYQARQQQISIVKQKLEQDQQLMRGDTSPLGTTTPPTTTIAPVSKGAGVTGMATQTVPQDTTGPYGDPRGTVTVSGTTSVNTVEVILKPVSYKAGFITGSPTMYTDSSTDYATNSNTWTVHGPLTVIGGSWSTKIPDTPAGQYTILIYNSAHQLIGTSKLTVKMSTLWGAPSATIDQSSLVSSSPKPIISGTAINTADVNVRVGDDYYTPHVVNGKWDTSYNPATVTSGTYPVVVKTQDTLTPVVLTTGTLVVK